MRRIKFFKFLALALSCSILFSNCCSYAHARVKKLKPGKTYHNKHWNYQQNNDGENTITLTKCRHKDVSELNPSSLEPYSVTRIGPACSYAKTKIDHRTKENFLSFFASLIPFFGIFYVAAEAQNRTTNKRYHPVFRDFVSIDLPECKSIEDCGFINCYKIKHINLPKCEKIGVWGLGFLKFDKFFPVEFLPERWRPGSWEGPYHKIPEAADNSLTSIALPNCHTLGAGAFAGRTHLETIDLPKCGNIGQYAFSRCGLSGNVNLPSCSKLGKYAFEHCHCLTSVNLPALKTLEHDTFFNCTSLTSVSMPELIEITGTDRWNEHAAFQQCPHLENLECPKLKTINHHSFHKCSSLKNFNLPNALVVGNNAFRDCTNLTNISLPKVQNIEPFTFFNCHNLTDINLPQVQKTGNNAFESCHSLTKLELPNIQEIGPFTFFNCHNLTDINLPQVQKTGNNAFESCHSLTKLELPNIQEIGPATFKNCKKLEHISLPNCKKICAKAFENCDSLKNIEVPKDCEIEESAIPLNKVISDCLKFLTNGNTKTVTKNQFNSLVVPDSPMPQIEKEFDAQDPTTGIKVHAEPGVFPEGAQLVVKKLEPKNIHDDAYKKALNNLDLETKSKMEKISLYDIKIHDSNSNIIQPNGKATVMIPIPDGMDETDINGIKVLEQKDRSFNSNIIELNNKKYCCFEVESFSIYGIVDNLSLDDIANRALPYQIAILISALLLGLYFVLKKRFKQKNNTAF